MLTIERRITIAKREGCSWIRGRKHRVRGRRSLRVGSEFSARRCRIGSHLSRLKPCGEIIERRKEQCYM